MTKQHLSGTGGRGRLCSLPPWMSLYCSRISSFGFRHSASATHPQREIAFHRSRQRLIGKDGNQIHLVLAQAFEQILAELGKYFEVAVTNGSGIEQQGVLDILQVLKARPAGEGEINLVAVPHLEDDDLVSLLAQHTDGLEEGGCIIKAVRDEQEQA